MPLNITSKLVECGTLALNVELVECLTVTEVTVTMTFPDGNYVVMDHNDSILTGFVGDPTTPVALSFDDVKAGVESAEIILYDQDDIPTDFTYTYYPDGVYTFFVSYVLDDLSEKEGEGRFLYTCFIDEQSCKKLEGIDDCDCDKDEEKQEILDLLLIRQSSVLYFDMEDYTNAQSNIDCLLKLLRNEEGDCGC